MKDRRLIENRNTFRELARVCSCNVIMLTNDGCYQQIDGLAMGSPPAPLLANGWMHKFDSIVRDDAQLFARYMDDYLRNIKANKIQQKLDEINNLHPSLQFTMENENNGSLPFLDMLIKRSEEGNLSSTWYSKKTDTGLLMNFHALAPNRYKRSVVAGMVHRIFRSCSTWLNFHESLVKAKKLLNANQYPPSFYNPIIEKCLLSLIEPPEQSNDDDADDETEKKMLFLQYRGKLTERFQTSLERIKAPCKVVLTLQKLKSTLPSLKPKIEKVLQSGVVYQITCPRCDSRYVGQSVRHLTTRVKEHSRLSSPVGIHFRNCEATISIDDDVKILCKARSQRKLLIVEALYIKELKPSILTRLDQLHQLIP